MTVATAGSALRAYLDRHIDALLAAPELIRRDQPDAVHQARVACRRIRATTRTFAAWLAVDTSDNAVSDAELAWFSGELGKVRDLEVIQARLTATIAELPDELDARSVAEFVDDRLTQESAARRAELMDAMASDRHAALHAALSGWRRGLAAPAQRHDETPTPVSPQSGTSAPTRTRVGDARRARPDDPIESLAPAVDRARRQLMKRLSQAAGPNGADADLHRARKAGKRARYAAEVLASELPAAAATATATATAATTDEATTDEAPAVGLARRLTRLQDILGEFQDSVIVATMARELADEARARGHGTQAFGALLAIEQQRQRRCRAAARQFWVEEMTPAGGDE